MTTVKAGYICKVCNVKTTDVEMREREKSEDIEHYAKAVARCCGFDHGMRSPFCKAQTVDLMVPISQNGIGFSGPELTEEQKADMMRQCKK